jgi:hypothetical protein
LGWISPSYGLFLLGAHSEIYEPFISLILFFFFSGCGKLWITETTDAVSADTGYECIAKQLNMRNMSQNSTATFL